MTSAKARMDSSGTLTSCKPELQSWTSVCARCLQSNRPFTSDGSFRPNANVGRGWPVSMLGQYTLCHEAAQQRMYLQCVKLRSQTAKLPDSPIRLFMWSAYLTRPQCPPCARHLSVSILRHSRLVFDQCTIRLNGISLNNIGLDVLDHRSDKFYFQLSATSMQCTTVTGIRHCMAVCCHMLMTELNTSSKQS